jgi:LysW-gamma-L-alpha-aminoadipyl-6-phosphate/LysW-L-glutamyl-5-phosphate reductase
MINVSIIGASGYAGGEILRILLNHPQVTINQATSQRYAGQAVGLVHPNLRGRTKLTFCRLEDVVETDLLFVCLPNRTSMDLMTDLMKLAPKIIDLGADFRLHDREVFESWYGSHTQPHLIGQFTYGIAELHRNEIKESSLVACAGCEATAITLGLYPLVKTGMIEKNVIADVKIGSSAAGNKATRASHHPERHNVLRSYQPTSHRHQAEVRQELNLDIEISATAVNLVRGILATIHTQLQKNVEEKDIWKAYRQVYGNEPFIRIVKQSTGLYRYPEPKILWGTNYCDIGFEKSPDSNRLVVLSAIDNLVKGTAGQAIQAMNLMYGFEETTGLEFAGLHPV